MSNNTVPGSGVGGGVGSLGFSFTATNVTKTQNKVNLLQNIKKKTLVNVLMCQYFPMSQ